MPKFVFLLFCCMAFEILPAQELQLAFHHLDQEDGLPPAADYFFSQGSRGFAWIGTDGGLCRFDGQALVRFANDPAGLHSLSENLVTSSCFEDANGNLWFTTFGAVQCLRRETGSFESWSLPGSGQKDYHAFHLDAGRLWLRIGSGREAALFHFDLGEKTFLRKIPMEGSRCTVLNGADGQPAFFIETKLPTRPGFVWRSMADGVGLHFEFLKTRDGRLRNYSSPTNAALPEGDSLVWFGVYNGLGVFYPKDRRHWIELDRLPGVPEDIGWVYGIVPLDGRRLLVSCSYGLAVFDKEKRKFIQLITPQPGDPLGLKTGVYEELFKDASGNIWVERNGQGVTFASLHKRKFAAAPELAGTSVGAIFEDRNGNVWCSTEADGTFVFDREKKLVKHLRLLDNRARPGEEFPLPEMESFFEDKTGNLWGASPNYFFFWDEKRGIFTFRDTYFQGVPSSAADELNLFFSLRNGDVLTAKGKDIFKVSSHPDKVSLEPWHDLSRFNLQIITAIFQDKKGRIYLADQTERLLVLTENQGKLQLTAEMENTGVCSGFLALGDSVVYAATSEGLLKIETANWHYRLLDLATDSIPNEAFYKILADKNGQLWLSGPNGLVRYDPQRKEFHRFNKADGLASKSANPNAFIVSSGGDFWLGGKNGLNVFRPEEVKMLDSGPPVYITQVFVNDTLFTQKNKGEITTLDLDYRRNTLSFRFAALDFSDPGSNQFYYRLQGYEEEWVFNGSEGFVRYPNLPPGSYTLEVKATNSDGMLGENIRSLALRIRPPFWRTWWFYGLCVLFVAGLLWAWSQYRLQQAVKMERLRVKISSDLHDEVGTLLSGLAMQTEVLELTARQEDKPRLHRIAELSRSAMLSMRDTVWAIDARKDKLENLLDRIREFAEETLVPKNFHFDLTLENMDSKKTLPVDVRQNLYLICKETLTNIAKHSNGDAVQVSLTRTGEVFEMRISDNGRVEEKPYKTTGLGLSNMRMRAERLGGSIEFSTENGFCVSVRIKTP
ncbi:MAG: two-component regulator propeller domain-containing protein [Saprospiraceae bacterium]